MKELILNSIDEKELRALIKEVLTETIRDKNPEVESKNDSVLKSRFEVVELLKISLPTLNNWTKKGILQSYRIGNRVLYKQNEVVQALIATKNLKYKRG
ncbi:MAG: helix-turn-helix domain-containing protein [Bacteroidales bacterium]|nr:helix-turn-helix domain-containing protein [Bacteroidales bacterium]